MAMDKSPGISFTRPAKPAEQAEKVASALMGRTKLKRMYEMARDKYKAQPMTEQDFASLEAIAPTATDDATAWPSRRSAQV